MWPRPSKRPLLMLVEKTKDAAHTLGEKRITIAGGVSANQGLQQALEAMCKRRRLYLLQSLMKFCPPIMRL